MASTVNKVPALGNVVQPELQREMNDHANRLNEIVGIEGLAGQTGVVHVVAGVPSSSLIVNADITNDTIVVGKLHFTATDKIAGRATAGAGAGEEITCTSFGRSLIDDTSAAAGRTTLGVSYGKQSFWVLANAWELGTAARGSYTDGSGHVWPVLDFDQTTTETAYFSAAMPKNWDLGNITFYPYWTAASGSGTVRWQINLGSVQDNESLGDAYSTGATSDDTLQTANNLHIGPESGTLVPSSGGESVATHDIIKLQLLRDPSNDTLNADARLIGIKVVYNTNLHTDD